MALTRLAPAFVASLALHGAAITGLEQLPRGWQQAERSASRSGAHVLQVRVREVTPSQLSAAAPSTSAAHKGTTARALEGIVPPLAYYPPHLLDERPQVRVHVEPVFPADAAVPAGRVLLHLYLDASGRVEEVVITEAEPRGVFEQAAAQAFAAARFTPGKIKGHAVKAVLTIEVFFGAPVPAGAPHLAADGPTP